MAFIELDCSLKFLYIIANGGAVYLVYDGKKEIISFTLSMTFSIIISLFLYYYDNRVSLGDSIKEKNNKLLNSEYVEIGENNEIKVTKVQQEFDFSLGLDDIQNKLFTYSIVFFLYFIIGLISLQRSIYTLSIYNNLEYISIITMILFYIFILKETLFRHHIISFIFFLIFVLIKEYYLQHKNRLSFEKRFILSIVYYTYNGILQYIMKILMVKYYVSPYIVSIANSSMQLFFNIIRYIIMAYFKTDVPVLKAEFFELNYNNITEFRKSLEFLVGNSANTILNSFIIYYYPPFLYQFSSFIANSEQFFTIKKNLESRNKYIIRLICDLGIYFNLFIFSEIIVMNICGMGFNTKKNIQRRGNLQVLCDESIIKNTTTSESSCENYDM